MNRDAEQQFHIVHSQPHHEASQDKQPQARNNSYDNSLNDAASRIYASLTQLKYSQHYHDTNALREYLLKEIKRFQQRAKSLGYDAETILIGRYALSAVLDETINKTPWGNKANWSKQNLLQAIKQDINANEHFFVILDKICQTPQYFIDAIELMYICLSLGFEGKFQHHPLEKPQLQKIIDQTYQIIRAQRGEFEKQLSSIKPHMQNRPAQPIPKKRLYSIIGIIIGACIILAGIYFTFNELLNIASNQVAQQIKIIDHGPTS